ncbi:MAG: 5-(carboxyamino)imidazole ribonucleotide mutase [Rhodobacterales bacterium]|nr:5-(carboxyamino)imidazole ribonucleotide mutase [Rhodobacterales bacterium]
MSTEQPAVGIIMGSQSDWPVMKNVALTLDKLGIAHEARVMSAHRTPDRLADYCRAARGRGLKVIIAGAGMAAALPGAAAALTPLPVLGVPMEGKLMGGLDALLAMAQMPGGVPVGTLAVGKAGAVNAAVLAASIVALSDPQAAQALDDFRAAQTAGVPELPED